MAKNSLNSINVPFETIEIDQWVPKGRGNFKQTCNGSFYCMTLIDWIDPVKYLYLYGMSSLQVVDLQNVEKLVLKIKIMYASKKIDKHT